MHEIPLEDGISFCAYIKVLKSLFSTIRLLNESNDQTDAYAALSSLQKIVVTEIIHASYSTNVGSGMSSLGKATKLFPIPAKATSDNNVKKLLLPHLTAMEHYPSMQSVRTNHNSLGSVC